MEHDTDIPGLRDSPLATRDLRAEHVHVLRMLKILEAMQGRMAAGEVPPPDDWGDVVNFLRVFVDRCHHGKEERVLFPAMMLVADDETKALVEELLVEHVEGRRLVSLLAAAVGAEPVLLGDRERPKPLDSGAASEGITGYVALIRPHVAHEEKRLYAVADRILAPALQETIQAEYDRIEDEVTGAGQHGAFEATVERLKERYLPKRRDPDASARH